MAGKVQVSAGSVYDLGYDVAWCPKYRRPVLTGPVKDRCEALISAKCSERGWQLKAPAGTSLDCHVCGARCIRPRQDTVICPRCGPWDADINGARNSYARAGLGSGQVLAA
jgi:Zn finger protein HypA/HybF involved in hydrogenase expression